MISVFQQQQDVQSHTSFSDGKNSILKTPRSKKVALSCFFLMGRCTFQITSNSEITSSFYYSGHVSFENEIYYTGLKHWQMENLST